MVFLTIPCEPPPSANNLINCVDHGISLLPAAQWMIMVQADVEADISKTVMFL